MDDTSGAQRNFNGGAAGNTQTLAQAKITQTQCRQAKNYAGGQLTRRQQGGNNERIDEKRPVPIAPV